MLMYFESYSQHATFLLCAVVASQRRCVVSSDGWISVNEVDKGGQGAQT